MQTLYLAGCIIRDENGKILLLHRNTSKRVQWEIPGGKIEEGETAANAARREVKEELGIDVDILDELGTEAFSENDYTMNYTWFSARIAGGSLGVKEPQTHDAYNFFSLSELQTMLSQLSPNAVNFLRKLQAGQVRL